MIYKVLAIAIAAVFLVSMLGFDDSWAVKSKGIPQQTVLSDNVCGLELCSISQNTEQKIRNYLENIEKSNIDAINFEDLGNSLAHITKTSIISKDFLLVHYSDGNWELLNRSESAFDIPSRGDGFLDLDSEPQETVGRLAISNDEMTRPLSSTNVKEIRIYGNVGEKAIPNVLFSIDLPDKPSIDFILSVDDAGNFEAPIKIKSDTTLGEYHITATYASLLIGEVSFTINENEILANVEHDDDQIVDSITLSTDQLTIPSSYATIQTIQIKGTLADYSRGNLIVLVIVWPDETEHKLTIRATNNGVFNTFLIITPEYIEGMYDIIVMYNLSEVARTSLTITSPTITLG